MKLLVDVSAGMAIAEVLRTLGHDVLSVRDRDARMSDADILAWAVAESRLVVTAAAEDQARDKLNRQDAEDAKKKQRRNTCTLIGRRVFPALLFPLSFLGVLSVLAVPSVSASNKAARTLPPERR